MALMSSRSWEEWVSEYALSHQHPANRLCHSIGIPMIAVSVLVSPLVFVAGLRWVPVALFAVGWTFQFIGHAYERKPPEFLKDWRFLFVGLEVVVREDAGSGVARLPCTSRCRIERAASRDERPPNGREFEPLGPPAAPAKGSFARSFVSNGDGWSPFSKCSCRRTSIRASPSGPPTSPWADSSTTLAARPSSSCSGCGWCSGS